MDHDLTQELKAILRSNGAYGDDCLTALPHKTIATRSGIGWVGKCALLITQQYGSMIRLSSILTDAPLATSAPVNVSKCGHCTACTHACPAGAIYGREWKPSVPRDELFDHGQCKAMAQSRSLQGFGQKADLCGKCIKEEKAVSSGFFVHAREGSEGSLAVSRGFETQNGRKRRRKYFPGNLETRAGESRFERYLIQRTALFVVVLEPKFPSHMQASTFRRRRQSAI